LATSPVVESLDADIAELLDAAAGALLAAGAAEAAVESDVLDESADLLHPVTSAPPIIAIAANVRNLDCMMLLSISLRGITQN
jgi:hypothetical protein